jgi:hypothetical protein
LRLELKKGPFRCMRSRRSSGRARISSRGDGLACASPLSRGRDAQLPGTAESPRGISPRGAHRTVRDSLPSHGSCHPVRAAALRHNQSVPPVAS